LPEAGCGVVLLLVLLLLSLLGLVPGLAALLLLFGIAELSLVPLVPEVPDDAGAGAAGGAAGAALLSAGAGVAAGVGGLAFSSAGLWQPASRAVSMAAPAIALMQLLVAFMIDSFVWVNSMPGIAHCWPLSRVPHPALTVLNLTLGCRYVRCLTEWR